MYSGAPQDTSLHRRCGLCDVQWKGAVNSRCWLCGEFGLPAIPIPIACTATFRSDADSAL